MLTETIKSSSYAHIYTHTCIVKRALNDYSNMKTPNLLQFTIILCSYKLSRWIAIMWETNSLIHYLIMLEEPKPNFSTIRVKILVLIVNTHLNN